MKKLIIGLLLCAMLICAIPFGISADEPQVPTASVYGYQVKENGTAYDYRVVGVLDLPEGYDLAKVTDIGFKIVVDNGVKNASETISCEMVYSSVKGGDLTYHAGTGEDTATDKYLGGSYLFALVIESAPWNLNGDFTPYVTYEGGEGDGANQNLVMMGLENFDPNMPTTLSDGTKIRLIPVTDGTLPLLDRTQKSVWATDFTGTTQTIFDGGKTIDLDNYAGMLVKITPDMETSGLLYRFQFKLANGTTIDMKSATRTYYWYDGTTWTPKTATAQQFTMPNKVEGYAYFEFTYGAENTTFPEVTSSEIANLKIYRPAIKETAAARFATISEWCLVQAIPTP